MVEEKLSTISEAVYEHLDGETTLEPQVVQSVVDATIIQIDEEFGWEYAKEAVKGSTESQAKSGGGTSHSPGDNRTQSSSLDERPTQPSGTSHGTGDN